MSQWANLAKDHLDCPKISEIHTYQHFCLIISKAMTI